MVTLQGRLDTTNADLFQQDIAELMQDEHPNIEFDCTDMEYTSSQGLRLFLMLQKRVNAKREAWCCAICVLKSKRYSTSPDSPTSSKSKTNRKIAELFS